jgi:D-erythro-7,8-dihydroneopterin triphosphate epimerase
MADRIHIRDLKLRCIIGVYPEERREKQDVLINIALECDCRKAGRTDDIADAVDYKGIKKRIVTAVEQSECELIESLAQRIADLCLESDGVESVTVAVDKPGALRFARSVAVEVTRP